MSVVFSDDEETENLHRELYDPKTTKKQEEVELFGMLAVSSKTGENRENVLGRALIDTRNEQDFKCAKTFKIKKTIDFSYFEDGERFEEERKTSISQLKAQREIMLKKLEENQNSPSSNRQRKRKIDEKSSSKKKKHG